jgi:hypothetical protein
MTAGPSSERVFHSALSATYDPVARGAIYVIDYSEDLISDTSTSSTLAIESVMLIEQSGRRFIGPSAVGNVAGDSTWRVNPTQSSLVASDFKLAAGPACAVGESCLDFSASGAPLSFGFARRIVLQAGQPATSITHGIDNWKVTVWRK